MSNAVSVVIHMDEEPGDVSDLYEGNHNEREVVRIALGHATILASREAAEALAAHLSAYLRNNSPKLPREAA